MTTQIIDRQNTAATQTVNPFSGAAATASAIPQADNPLAASDAARAVAEVQAALLVARMNPRDPVRAMDRILNACTRPTLAESSTYAFSRGGTSVTGPTIRLAEALAQGWGNIQYGLRELSQKNGVSTVAAYAWDVETNTRREIQFQVALRRDTKRGSYELKDGRDIYELVANQGARRLRSCILSVIPGDVVDAALQQCAATMKANVRRLRGYESSDREAHSAPNRHHPAGAGYQPPRYLRLAARWNVHKGRVVRSRKRTCRESKARRLRYEGQAQAD